MAICFTFQDISKLYSYIGTTTCTHVLPSSSYDQLDSLKFIWVLMMETVPVTSQACWWKQPRNGKESIMPLAEAVFEKHVYGKEKKRKLKPLEDFDPCPVEFRGMVQLPFLLYWHRFMVSICASQCSLVSTSATGTVLIQWQSLHFLMKQP